MNRWLTASLALSFGLVFGCGSSTTTPSGTGGTSGQGGAGTGGMAGSTPDAGGGTGGMAGAGTGGTGGGSGGGGSGGSGVGPDAGNSNPGHDARLDECFKGLRPLMGRNNQVATKRSANGAYQLRVALEAPADGVGTSGTVPWKAIRLAVVLPNKYLCLEEDALRSAYKTSLHNCSDVLTASDGGLNYKLEAPDTDPTRGDTTLSITGEAAILPVKLMTSECIRTGGAACKSGGPCQ